jgi:hypothetical protein
MAVARLVAGERGRSGTRRPDRIGGGQVAGGKESRHADGGQLLAKEPQR